MALSACAGVQADRVSGLGLVWLVVELILCSVATFSRSPKSKGQ